MRAGASQSRTTMSKTKAEIAEDLAVAEARVEELEGLLSEAQAEIESRKEKAKRDINSYKTKLKQAAKDEDKTRQQAFEEAREAADGVVTQAKTIRKRLLAQSLKDKGPVYVAAVEAKIAVIDQIFGV